MLPRFYLPTNQGKARYSKADSSADHATEAGLAIPAAADLALNEHTAVSVANGCTGSGAVAFVVGIDGAGEAGRGSAGGWVGDADDLGLDWGGRAGGRSGHADSTAESRSTGTRSHLGCLFGNSKRLQLRWASPFLLLQCRGAKREGTASASPEPLSSARVASSGRTLPRGKRVDKIERKSHV